LNWPTPVFSTVADLVGVRDVSHVLLGLACLALSALVVVYLKHQREGIPRRAFGVLAAFLVVCGLAQCLEGAVPGASSGRVIGGARLGMAVACCAAVFGFGWLIGSTSARQPAPDGSVVESRRAEEVVLWGNDLATRKLALVACRTDNAVMITDAHGRINWVNEGFTRLTEYSLLEVIGRLPSSILLGPESDPRVVAFMREHVRAGMGFSTELINYSKSGRSYWVSIEVQPIHDASGRLEHFIAIESDITARKQAEAGLIEINGRLNAVLNAATHVSIISTDPEGLITVFNAGAERMFGYTAAEMIGKVTPVVLHLKEEIDEHGARLSAEFGKPIGGFDAFVERARQGSHEVREWTYVRKDGSLLTALLVVTAVRDEAGRVTGFLGIGTDVTDERRAEEQLKQHAQELAEADRRKNEFLAMLAHELRNPLAPIRNALSIMKKRDSDDALREWAREMVDQQVQLMARLIDDLIDISRVASGKIRLRKEWVSLGPVVANAVETSRPIIEGQHHQLSVALPAESVLVEADPTRLAQVLANLLNNASKYTPPGGRISLSAALEGSEVVFRVRDNGMGIPPDMLGRVFDLFAQLDDSLDHSQGGLGIGLTLVQRLVDLHDGNVQAFSAGPDRGSEFVVRLPRARLEAPGAVEPSHVAPTDLPRATNRRVLVVDDNVPSAQSLATVLKLEGFDVHIVHDGPSALQAVPAYRPDVLLLDIGLPGLDGYEVARRLRARPDGGALVIIALTGYADDESRRRTREAGCDQHLTKPLDPDLLLSLLSSLEWSGITPDLATAGGGLAKA
jgi:PAS domain S-box-containing protein